VAAKQRPFRRCAAAAGTEKGEISAKQPLSIHPLIYQNKDFSPFPTIEKRLYEAQRVREDLYLTTKGPAIVVKGRQGRSPLYPRGHGIRIIRQGNEARVYGFYGIWAIKFGCP
jgi:hypothetical protein